MLTGVRILIYKLFWGDLAFTAAAQAQARIKILEKLPDLEPPEAEDKESFK